MTTDSKGRFIPGFLGKTVVAGAAVLLTFLFLYSYFGRNSSVSLIAGIAIVLLLVTELFWGSRWVRWVVGVLFLGWAIQGFIWFSQYSLFGHTIHLLEALFGVSLLVSRQAREYMETRRAITKERFGRLRYLPPVICGAAMVLVVFLDVLKVTGNLG